MYQSNQVMLVQTFWTTPSLTGVTDRTRSQEWEKFHTADTEQLGIMAHYCV